MSIRYIIICKAEDHEKQQIWITAIFTMHNKYYQCDRHKMMIVAGAPEEGNIVVRSKTRMVWIVTQYLNCIISIPSFPPRRPLCLFSASFEECAKNKIYKEFSWIVNAHEFNKLINETVSCSSTPDQTLKPACLQPLNCGASSSSALAQTGWGQRDPPPSIPIPSSCVL